VALEPTSRVAATPIAACSANKAISGEAEAETEKEIGTFLDKPVQTTVAVAEAVRVRDWPLTANPVKVGSVSNL